MNVENAALASRALQLRGDRRAASQVGRRPCWWRSRRRRGADQGRDPRRADRQDRQVADARRRGVLRRAADDRHRQNLQEDLRASSRTTSRRSELQVGWSRHTGPIAVDIGPDRPEQADGGRDEDRPPRREAQRILGDLLPARPHPKSPAIGSWHPHRALAPRISNASGPVGPTLDWSPTRRARLAGRARCGGAQVGVFVRGAAPVDPHARRPKAVAPAMSQRLEDWKETASG